MNALTGNTTDLRLLVAVIRLLKERGFHDITIGDGTSSGFYRNKIDVISRLRIDRLARRFGVKTLDLNYTPHEAIDFEEETKVRVSKLCREADLFINLPKLKMHFETMMSVCLKNLIGCLVGLDSKQKVHDSLAKNILHLNRALKPHLHIVDGLIGMEGTGPSRGTPVKMNLVIAGDDPFAVDLLCARLVGVDHWEVPVLRTALRLGSATSEHVRHVDGLDLSKYARSFCRPKANVLARLASNQRWQRYLIGIRLHPFVSWIFNLDTVGKLLNWSGLRQDIFNLQEPNIAGVRVLNDRCDDCRICSRYCPMLLNPPHEVMKSSECIECLYCYLVCPVNAMQVDGELGFLEEQLKRYGEIVRNMSKESR